MRAHYPSLKTVYPVGTELSIDEYEIVKNKIMVLGKKSGLIY